MNWEKTLLPKRLRVSERHFHPDLIQRTVTCKDENDNSVQCPAGKIGSSPGAVRVPSIFPEYLPSLQTNAPQPRPSPAKKAAKRKCAVAPVIDHAFAAAQSSELALTFQVLIEEVYQWFTLWRRANMKVDWQLMASAERVYFFVLHFDLEEPRITRGITVPHDLSPKGKYEEN